MVDPRQDGFGEAELIERHAEEKVGRSYRTASLLLAGWRSNTNEAKIHGFLNLCDKFMSET